MKLPLSTHSLVLLVFPLFTSHFALGLSVDSKADKLQPRLDGSNEFESTSSTIASSSTLRRPRKKCSRTGTAVIPATHPIGSGVDSQYQNSTTLVAPLPYPRTSGDVYPLHSTIISASGENSDNQNSRATATLSGGCERSTLTVTDQVYITVTANSNNSSMSSSAHNTSATGSSTGVPLSVIFPWFSTGTDTSGIAEATQSASIPTLTESLPAANATSNSSKTGYSASGGSSTVDPVSAQITTSAEGPASTVDQPSPTTARPSFSTTSALPGTGQTSGDPSNSTREFWAGADIDTVPRMLALPGRTVYDFDGKTVKDPIQILADAGVNSFRVETWRGDCIDEKPFVNNASSVANEQNFKLDFGCIGTKVKLAKQAIGLGMKMQLTINQGLKIPDGMEKYNYAEMVDEVAKETKRQLQPFLDANILPDIILFENEGSDGFLFHEVATGHDRTSNDGKASEDVVNQERCGQIPAGKMNSYPQWAGYNKAEVEACNQAIQAAGFSTDAVRYGLHSHGQYVQWKEGVVHGPKRPSQTKLTKLDGSPCEGPNPIPSDILALDVSKMLTIAGFSAYPDPMRPADIKSDASIELTLNRLNKTLTQLQGYAEEYGKYSDGPFAGQYKLQGLGVEYATRYHFASNPSKSEMRQQQRHTEVMWSFVKNKFPATFLGMMWWEPWYCHNNWEGGDGTLCHLTFDGDKMGEVPTDTLKTWGAAAVSPWKKAKA